jgi:serine/threonine protein kinase/Tol biopolymer transport system component
MGLAPGSRFGVYEIAARIGSGGMGEVYRARDTNLDREVALKLVPDAFVRDPERLSRFEREAKTLAVLNHPNIAQIYGLESHAGSRAIVMELVAGENLSERLARGPMPLDEALPVARQIAEALEAAHGSGVVHRDLKPANIMLRPDGTVKVLDFGLAKLAANDTQAVGAAITNSPTMTSPVMTQAGIILGTAAYMSPEQAKGRPVDKRADVWAFGCVLYEMLTGHPVFAAEDAAETLAAVLRKEPDWTLLRADTPDAVRRLLRRCLMREPRQRLSDISVVRFEIDDAIADPRAAPVRSTRRAPWVIAAAAAGAGIVIGATAAVKWHGATPLANPTTRVLQIASGENIASPQLSPDGRKAVYLRNERLIVRSLESDDERELSEAGRAVNPFWSPDGAQIGYFADGELGWEIRAVPASGGATRLIVRNSRRAEGNAEPSTVAAAAWCATGIVYAEAAGQTLRQVNDGEGQLVTMFEAKSQGSYAYPHCLKDGRILAVHRSRGTASVVVITPSTETVLLEVPASSQIAVRFPVMVGSNQIVFERTEPSAGLWLLPVTTDLSRSTGQPRLVVPEATRPTVGGDLLAYVSGRRAADRQLVWVNRQGTQQGTFGRPQREFKTPTLSPDGSQVIRGGRRLDADGLWLHRQNSVERWSETGEGEYPAWSPDGRQLAYVSGPPTALVVRAASDSAPRVLVSDERRIISPSWTPEGTSLVYSDGSDVWLIAVAPGSKARRILEQAREPAVSPDSSLIAFSTSASGRPQVYVTTFPNAGQRLPLSTDGGRVPRWTSNGKELFFACGAAAGDGPGALRALCVTTMESRVPLRWQTATELFDAAARGLMLITFGHRGYDIAPDGSRILTQTQGSTGTPVITLIENTQNWLQQKTQQ